MYYNGLPQLVHLSVAPLRAGPITTKTNRTVCVEPVVVHTGIERTSISMFNEPEMKLYKKFFRKIFFCILWIFRFIRSEMLIWIDGWRLTPVAKHWPFFLELIMLLALTEKEKQNATDNMDWIGFTGKIRSFLVLVQSLVSCHTELVGF